MGMDLLPIDSISAPIATANNLFQILERFKSNSENSALISDNRIDKLAAASSHSGRSITYAVSKSSDGNRQEVIQFH